LTPDLLDIVVLSVDRLRLPVLRDDSMELDDDATDDDELLKSPCC
jgi:hypothetical protein